MTEAMSDRDQQVLAIIKKYDDLLEEATDRYHRDKLEDPSEAENTYSLRAMELHQAKREEIKEFHMSEPENFVRKEISEGVELVINLMLGAARIEAGDDIGVWTAITHLDKEQSIIEAEITVKSPILAEVAYDGRKAALEISGTAISVKNG